MIVQETKLKGVLLLKPEPFSAGKGELFSDSRGTFLEIWNESKFKQLGIDIHFEEDDISVSKKNVLRGLHGDDVRFKLITCISGKVFFVALNADTSSTSFGAWDSVELSEENRWSILVPPKHASGYLVLTDNAIVHYKQSGSYDPGSQFAYKWNDPRFKIPWPVKNPILSARDSA
jgi:dTDP-4-dehydrorhamnose 3,5-epimerase